MDDAAEKPGKSAALRFERFAWFSTIEAVHLSRLNEGACVCVAVLGRVQSPRTIEILRPQVTIRDGELSRTVGPPQRRGNGWHKPARGSSLWTSTYTPGELSGWIEWCASECPDCLYPDAYILTPKPARIVVVNSVADLDNVVARYGEPDRDSGFMPMDFIAMAVDFDAMHLTEAGQWATRLSFPNNLYGWDCESTVWFRWMFEDDVQHVKTADLMTEGEKLIVK